MCHPIQSVIILTNQTPTSWSSNLANHSYEYKPNWSVLGPITTSNQSSRKSMNLLINQFIIKSINQASRQ